MKIDLNQTKYVLPLIALPFLFLINYGYQSFSKGNEINNVYVKEEGIKPIGDVSEEIQKMGLDNKLDAFKSRYQRATDGYTAIENLKMDTQGEETIDSAYHEKGKKFLDSIDNAFKSNYMVHESSSISNQLSPQQSVSNISREDEKLAKALEQLGSSSQEIQPQPGRSRYDDPMVLFKEQMAVIDSFGKANDPQYQEQLKLDQEDKVENQEPEKKAVTVNKASSQNELFNTIQIEKDKSFIKAIIDEDLKKGSVGERIRIRILEDIMVGKKLIHKGSYIYALISGFSAQRVKLTVSNIMVEDRIFPVKLSIYDHDGLEGLYVPASAFREFSKELGSSSTGGMNLQMQQDPSSIGQFYMSTLQRMFTSTSQALSKAIKQNRANLKYGTQVYLINPEELYDEETF